MSAMIDAVDTSGPHTKRKPGILRRFTSGSASVGDTKEMKEAKTALKKMEKLSEVFKKLPTVEAVDGTKIQVQTFWSKGPVVLYFIRRFGCILCRHNAAILSRCKTALEAKGIRFIAVGPEHEGMEEFVAEGYFAGEVYADPNRACYKALKLKRGSLLSLLSHRVRTLIATAANLGIKGNMKGDLKQLGGLFVMSPEGDKGHCKVTLEFRDAFFGDAVDTVFMFQALGIREGDAGYKEGTERRKDDFEDTNVPDSAMADKNECVACIRSAILEEQETKESDEHQKIQTVLVSRAMEPMSGLQIKKALTTTENMKPPSPPPRRLTQVISLPEMKGA